MDEKKSKGLPGWSIYVLSLIGFVYLLNPTAGVLEFIPDNLPLVGNLDEGAAALLLWQGINHFLQSRKSK